MRLTFLTVFVVLVGLASHAALARWSIRMFPAFARHTRRTFLVALVPPLAMPVLRVFVRHWGRPGAVLLKLVQFEGVLVLFVVLLLLLVEGTFLLFRSSGDTDAEPADPPRADESPRSPTSPESVSRRVVLERGVGLASAGAVGGLLGWGYARGRLAFQVDEVVVRIPGLSKGLDGYVIAQVSDVHVGAFVREHELDRGLDLVRRMKPDAVVATGDLVDSDPRDASLVARALADLPSRDGVFAIPGNHDHYAGAGDVEAALRAAGVTVLTNVHRVLRAGDGGFVLAGVDDPVGTRIGRGPDLGAALRGAPRDLPTILLAHRPDAFAEMAGKVALQLSGHTHGGQIYPGWSPLELASPWVRGRYTSRGSTLYVNRGFGTTGPPSRLGSPPEITKIVLVAA
ncbi:MAG: metallophosphoesterase [Polyangiaceae bacterium]